MEIIKTDENQAFMASTGHTLCLGGPGSGKTTAALLKAQEEINRSGLKPGQRILFLSFARATIFRIEEQATSLMHVENRQELEISTYHGFAWQILRSHGYLLTEATPIALLPPPQAAAALSAIQSKADKFTEKKRLFFEEGRLDFDLFATLAAELLQRSRSLCLIYSKIYPIIILDEFQDTDANEWRLIQTLSVCSRMIALADPEQRIYEFRGASPTRISDFINKLQPERFNFSNANYRSSGTDICRFGNDLLNGANRGKAYSEVSVEKYPFRKGNSKHLYLKITVLERRREILKRGIDNWSIGILVPTSQLMLEASSYLTSSQKIANQEFGPIANEAALDTAGPALAATAISGVLSGGIDTEDIARNLIGDLSQHIRGRRGGKSPSKQRLAIAIKLDEYLNSGYIRGSKRKAIIDECRAIADTSKSLTMSGDPIADWLTICNLFGDAHSEELKMIAEDARVLKFLNRGRQLRTKLSEIWRSNGNYENANKAVKLALTQEHFAATKRGYHGIHVMTIHKAKGKQFTEVIIYEGLYRGRILRSGSDEKEKAQARLSLRVGVTRAEQFTTILTSEKEPCPFL